MSQKGFTIAQLADPKNTGIKYDTVKAYGDTVHFGTLSTDALLDWFDSNAAVDGEDLNSPVARRRRREADIRLIVRGVVDAESKERIPDEQQEEFIKIFLQKDADENKKVAEAILKLAGLKVPTPGAVKETVEDAKNGSSEAGTGASATA